MNEDEQQEPQEEGDEPYELLDEDDATDNFLTPNEQAETAKKDVADAYDIYDLVSRVHSPVPILTRDFTIARLQDAVVTDKVPKFIVEQIKTISVIRDYHLVPQETLREKYANDPDTAKHIRKQLLKEADKISTFLLQEIYTIIVLSRSFRGDVLLAMLTHGRTAEERRELAGEMTQGGLKERLLEQQQPQQPQMQP